MEVRRGCTKLDSSTASKVGSHAANATASKVRSHAANATALATEACNKLRDSAVATATKVKDTVKSRTAIASEFISDLKSRDSLSKFAVNASINAAKTLPGGVGTAVDIISQSIPEKKNQEDEYIKRIEALENEVKELRQKKDLKPFATSKL